jgi:hypothetical protein
MSEQKVKVLVVWDDVNRAHMEGELLVWLKDHWHPVTCYPFLSAEHMKSEKFARKSCA